jgi:hypothetical protein
VQENGFRRQFLIRGMEAGGWGASCAESPCART